MYTDIHTDFILTPIRTILEEGINASQSLPSGIESFPLSEYHLQSLFLRMTGASEQKIKCIFWQMATDDIRYRYLYLNYQGLGECSTYKSKNTAYKDLITQITKSHIDFDIKSIWDDFKYEPSTVAQERAVWEGKVNASKQKQIDYLVKKRIDEGKPMTSECIQKMTDGVMCNALKEEDFKCYLSANKRQARVSQILDEIINLCKDTNLAEWRFVDLNNYIRYCHKTIKGCDVAEANGHIANLLSGGLVELYEKLVYEYRNRIAHNTIVYQKNLPELDTLADKNYHLYNYFFRFAIIIVIDEVFIRLYRRYMEVFDAKN